MDDLNIPAQGEEVLDFSGDKQEDREVHGVITAAGLVTKDKGTQLVIEVGGDGIPKNTKISEWVKHENPKAQSIGRANLRRIGKQVIDVEVFPPSQLVGARVQGKLGEDNNGFLRLKNLRKDTAAASAQSIG